MCANEWQRCRCRWLGSHRSQNIVGALCVRACLCACASACVRIVRVRDNVCVCAPHYQFFAAYPVPYPNANCVRTATQTQARAQDGFETKLDASRVAVTVTVDKLESSLKSAILMVGRRAEESVKDVLKTVTGQYTTLLAQSRTSEGVIIRNITETLGGGAAQQATVVAVENTALGRSGGNTQPVFGLSRRSYMPVVISNDDKMFLAFPFACHTAHTH